MRDEDRDGAERELQQADLLLRKADALLLRRHGIDPPGIEDDDLPLVTEVVATERLPQAAVAVATDAPPPAPSGAAPMDPVALAEQLIDVDSAVCREVELWLSRELPGILSRELDALSERIHGEVLAQMRATLLPRLSEKIASRLTQPTLKTPR